jgi:hypothetical protein
MRSPWEPGGKRGYAASSMAPRNLPGAAALVLLVIAACGGRSPLDVPACNAPATAYCQTDGCPFTGPAANTPEAIMAWCSAAAAFAPRVVGYGPCVTPGGQPWATAVQATDASGDSLYVLYDPTTGELLSVSTLAPGSDGGSGETNYGTCGENTGIVDCIIIGHACDR